jgi:hypothetical protein
MLLIALFFEVGLVLLVVPWSSFWDRNYFAESFPLVQVVARNLFVRGAVSGIGVVNIAAGVAEIFSLFLARHGEAVQPPSLSTSHPAED